MAKRKVKVSEGKYKKELRNEPIKIELNQQEADILAKQVGSSGMTQSKYLRFLLLDAPHRTVVEAKVNSRYESFIHEIIDLGRQLNRVTHQANTQILAKETLEIVESPVFADITTKLEALIAEAYVLTEPVPSRDIQKKFLLTLSEVESAKAKLKVKQLTLSRYMRQQIMGVSEVKNDYTQKIAGQIGRLDNNINQLLTQIRSEERRHRLVIIDPSTKQEIIHVQKTIERAKSSVSL